MNKIYNFDQIEDKILKNIYFELWNDKSLPGEIEKTWWRNGEAKNSYQFKVPGIEKREIYKDDYFKIKTRIKLLFNINNEFFDKRFDDCCLGQGHEYREISRLHSSSLCAFLFFQNILRSNPLKIKIDEKVLEFTEVYFEYKNKVLSIPSNIDIVLTGMNLTTGKKVIFFLESKFSEYLNIVNVYRDLGTDYLLNYGNKYYSNSFLNKLDLELCLKNGEPQIFEHKKNGKIIKTNGFRCCSKEDKLYLDGIKQMISHYIGVENFVESKVIDNRLSPNDSEVYLGELLFDFSFREARDSLENYSKYYKKLAKNLNEINPKIHLVENVLRYSLFKEIDYQLPKEIKQFYFGT